MRKARGTRMVKLRSVNKDTLNSYIWFVTSSNISFYGSFRSQQNWKIVLRPNLRHEELLNRCRALMMSWKWRLKLLRFPYLPRAEAKKFVSWSPGIHPQHRIIVCRGPSRVGRSRVFWTAQIHRKCNFIIWLDARACNILSERKFDEVYWIAILFWFQKSKDRSYSAQGVRLRNAIVVQLKKESADVTRDRKFITNLFKEVFVGNHRATSKQNNDITTFDTDKMAFIRDIYNLRVKSVARKIRFNLLIGQCIQKYCKTQTH